MFEDSHSFIRGHSVLKYIFSICLQTMVNRSKSKMLCLPIIMSSWLCSYMNTVGEESREKPLMMLQYLQNISTTEGEVYFTER